VSYSLAGKVVLVTGASAGIGAACARGFAREGAKLLLCARRVDTLNAMEQELRALGAKDVHSFELDVRDNAKVEGAISSLPEAWQQVEVLVNNAGLSRGLTKLYLDAIEDWEEMID
jgi:NADP-dependent 3-hydroxy acid dehydrogenase YdfG